MSYAQRTPSEALLTAQSTVPDSCVAITVLMPHFSLSSSGIFLPFSRRRFTIETNKKHRNKHYVWTRCRKKAQQNGAMHSTETKTIYYGRFCIILLAAINHFESYSWTHYNKYMMAAAQNKQAQSMPHRHTQHELVLKTQSNSNFHTVLHSNVCKWSVKCQELNNNDELSWKKITIYTQPWLSSTSTYVIWLRHDKCDAYALLGINVHNTHHKRVMKSHHDVVPGILGRDLTGADFTLSAGQ